MVDITEISAMVAAAGVIVGVVFAIIELRNLVKQRQTDLLVKIAPWINISSIELQQAVIRVLNTEYKDYDDFLKRYGQIHSEKPEQTALLAVLNYLEGIGILMRRKLVDVGYIYDFWSGDIATIWEKVKPIVEGERRKWNYPLLLNAEYLYDEVKKREQQASKTA